MMIGLIILAIVKLQHTGRMGSHLPWQRPWLDDMLFVRNPNSDRNPNKSIQIPIQYYAWSRHGLICTWSERAKKISGLMLVRVKFILSIATHGHHTSDIQKVNLIYWNYKMPLKMCKCKQS